MIKLPLAVSNLLNPNQARLISVEVSRDGDDRLHVRLVHEPVGEDVDAKEVEVARRVLGPMLDPALIRSLRDFADLEHHVEDYIEMCGWTVVDKDRGTDGTFSIRCSQCR